MCAKYFLVISRPIDAFSALFLVDVQKDHLDLTRWYGYRGGMS